ncbi:MAG: glutaminase [Verrucomicrobiota bacterium]
MPIVTQALIEDLLTEACAEVRRSFSRKWYRMDMPGSCDGEAACWASRTSCVVAGDHEGKFTLMSAIKPFLLLHLLETRGADEVESWVDDLPSSRPYWSLDELREDGGRPRNAMLNSGAMLLASQLDGDHPLEQQASFLAWLSALCPEASLTVDEACLAEVLAPGADPHNLALARELEAGSRVADALAAFEIYFRLCCLSGSIRDMAHMGNALSHSPAPHRDRVLRTMVKCGLYEASADWFAKTGLAAKSGVSGVIFGIWPGEGCLAACGEWQDPGGNAMVPLRLLERAARAALPAPLQAKTQSPGHSRDRGLGGISDA